MNASEHCFLSYVALGIFTVLPSGVIWRNWERRNGKWVPCYKRAETGSARKGKHLRVRFTNEHGKRLTVSAHRVVLALHKRLPLEPGMVVNHKDLDMQNNHVNNLTEVTPCANTRHYYNAVRFNF